MEARRSIGHKFLLFACVILAAQGMWCAIARSESAAAPSEALVFPTGGIVFPTDGVDFPTSQIVFPSSLDVVETPTTIEITLAADVLFDFDKADIRSVAEPTLHDLAQIIRDKAHGPVNVQGFTDALGSDEYNRRLSERRAASVKAWLVAREKLLPGTLSTAGFGARNPVAPNRHLDGTDDPEGRQRNRRVTVIIRR